MIISEFPENGKESSIANIQTEPKNKEKIPESSSSSSVVKAFWGVKVSPEEPVTINFHNRPHKLLQIYQATLGAVCSDNEIRNERSVLSCKIGDNLEVLLCSLRLRRREMTKLCLNFEGPDDIVFSVKGPCEIHLIGYLSDDPSSTVEVEPLQTFDNGGGESASTKTQFLSSNEGVVAPESAPTSNTSSHLPLLNIPSLSNLCAPYADGSNNMRKDKSINILLQGVTIAQIEALSKGMVDKLGTNSVRRKLDYLMVNEEEARVDQVVTHGTTQAIAYNEESGPSGNSVERSKEHDSPEYHVLRSRKSKLNKRKKHEDGGGDGSDQDDHIRSTRHGSPDYYVLQPRKKKSVNKQKKHDDDDDHMRSTNHKSIQHLGLDSKEAKRMKKKLKKQKQAEDEDNSVANNCQEIVAFDSGEAEKPTKHVDDECISIPEDSALDTRETKKARKKKNKNVQEGARDDKVANDRLENVAFDSEEAEKSNKHVVDGECNRIPEDSALDTRKTKKARKQKKKNAEEGVRSAQHVQQEDTAPNTRETRKTREPKENLVQEKDMSQGPQRVVVCGLPFQIKR